MNTGFIWGLIICFVSIVIIGVAIALYFLWKDRDDYDEEKKIIVWSVAAAGGLTLIFGIIFVIWGAGKKESDDSTRRAIVKNQQAQGDEARKWRLADVQARTSPLPPPVTPLATEKVLKTPAPKRAPDTRPVKKPKKVTFALPGSSVTSKKLKSS